MISTGHADWHGKHKMLRVQNKSESRQIKEQENRKLEEILRMRRLSRF